MKPIDEVAMEYALLVATPDLIDPRGYMHRLYLLHESLIGRIGVEHTDRAIQQAEQILKMVGIYDTHSTTTGKRS